MGTPAQGAGETGSNMPTNSNCPNARKKEENRNNVGSKKLKPHGDVVTKSKVYGVFQGA